MDTKVCLTCKDALPLDSFARRKSKDRIILRSHCKPCHRAIDAAWRKAHPDSVKAANRRQADKMRQRSKEFYWANPTERYLISVKKTYGLKKEEYYQLQAVQEYKCGICGIEDPGGPYLHWPVDHCHKTKQVRGLLCKKCNLLLGYAQDNPETLRAAIAYLQNPPAKAVLSE